MSLYMVHNVAIFRKANGIFSNGLSTKILQQLYSTTLKLSWSTVWIYCIFEENLFSFCVTDELIRDL